MTRSTIQQWGTACAATMLLSAGVGLAAQSTTQPNAGSPKADELIVTGCLAAENAAGHFVLTGATLTGEAKTSGNMPPNRSSTDTEKVQNAPGRYRLSGADLNAHVGQRVEVTGTLEERKPDAPANGSNRDTVGTAGAGTATATDRGGDRIPRPDADVPLLQVREVKPLPGTCS